MTERSDFIKGILNFNYVVQKKQKKLINKKSWLFLVFNHIDNIVLYDLDKLKSITFGYHRL